jgi:N-acetylglucosamine-6-sulfatase
VLFAVAALALPPSHPASATPPVTPQNIVLILTDDQRWDSLQYMPNVQSLLAAHGVTFANAMDNNPLCCPTRATIMTGLTSGHNGVWWNRGLHGGFDSFVRRGDQDRQVFLWLHAAGYRTGFIGKFLTNYRMDDLAWTMPGVDDWQPFLLDEAPAPCQTGERTAGYWATCYANNGTVETHDASEYSTTTSGDKAASFIRGASPGQPLFLFYAPRAPHTPTLPQPQYAGACGGVPPLSGVPSYDRTILRGPAYMARRSPASAFAQAKWAALWVDDCRTLLSVDDQVGNIVQALQDTGRLNDTLIMFTSDNGFSFLEHRWHGKVVPYDESIRVPLVVRDDAVIPPSLQGSTSPSLVTSLDDTPTFLEAAGLSRSLDGASLLPLIDGTSSGPGSRDVLIEHAGGTVVPAYCGVRAPGFMYARYATREEELYDLTADPYELRNVAGLPGYAATLGSMRASTRALCSPTPPGFSW